MKIKILKSFWHGEDRYETGSIVEVSNNMAHGLLEAGFAMKIKELEEAPKDKMISKKRGRKKVMTK